MSVNNSYVSFSLLYHTQGKEYLNINKLFESMIDRLECVSKFYIGLNVSIYKTRQMQRVLIDLKETYYSLICVSVGISEIIRQ